MTTGIFSLGEALRFGWQAFKRNVAMCIGIGVAGIAATLLLNGASQAAQPYPALAMAFGVLTNLIEVFFGVVWLRFALRVHDDAFEVRLRRGGPLPRARDLVPSLAAFLDYLAATLLYGLLVLGGLVLLVVPGIYLAVRYGLVPFLVADGQADVLGAFRRSSELTLGNRWHLLGVGLVLFLLNALGATVFGVGLLFTVPISVFAGVFVYRHLLAHGSGERLIDGRPAPLMV